ncbi:MAG: methyltransferase domain-containing protein [Candidatus Aminicenantes bacterium]|nr:methyltransferase domain-containing protein [Candidatus Aminicenantes bacterium]
MFKHEKKSVKNEIERLSPWYSTIELYPGVFTSGHMLRNIALTRELIRRCEVKGLRCLDIGAMEAVATILLKRRGAADVIAVDGDNRAHKMPLLKSAYEVDFQYFGNIALHNTLDFLLNKSRLEAVGGRPYRFGFDLIVLSGVLYHVYSPVHVLATARSCLRKGGLMIIETAAVNDPGFTMQYNFTGDKYIYDWTDTWFISAPLLDYFCRFFRMEPLDCVYLPQENRGFRNLIRLGVVCRAVDSEPAADNESIMGKSTWNYDHNSIVRYDLTEGNEKEPVPYHRNTKELVLRDDIKTCDIYKTINSGSPFPVTEDRLILKLHDKC